MLHSVWHVNILLLLPKEGKGNSLSQKRLPKGLTRLGKPGPWGRAGKPEGHVAGAGPFSCAPLHMVLLARGKAH